MRAKYGGLFYPGKVSDIETLLSLLKDALKATMSRTPTIYLVIDGLNIQSQSAPLYLLLSLIPQLPSLRWIISSRHSNLLASSHRHITSELVLSVAATANAFGLGKVIACIRQHAIDLDLVYKTLRHIPRAASDDFSWFEHTFRGRDWLAGSTFIDSNSIWYRPDEKKTSPFDFGLQVMDKIQERGGVGGYGAYFSFSFIENGQSPSGQHRKYPAFNPFPALWCLFTQLACQKYESEDDLVTFVLSLSQPMRLLLQDISAPIHDMHLSERDDQGAMKDAGWYSVSKERCVGWIPFDSWHKLPGEPYGDRFVSLVSLIDSIADRSSVTLIIDSFHLADTQKWIDFLGYIRHLPIRLFVSGTYEQESETQLNLISSLLGDPLDEREEYLG